MKNLQIIILVLLVFLAACSDDSQDQTGLGESYVVDLTKLPTEAEGELILNPDSGGKELSGVFQVGAHRVDIRVAKDVARAAKINTEKQFEAEVKVTIQKENEKSSGYHQIFQISAIEKL